MRGWRKTWISALAVGLPALLVVAACGGSSTPSGSTLNFTMTIGDVEPFTGDLGALGAPSDKAVKLAVDQLNKASQQAGTDPGHGVEAPGHPWQTGGDGAPWLTPSSRFGTSPRASAD